MSTPKWINDLFNKTASAFADRLAAGRPKGPSSQPTRKRHSRPRLEVLEDRAVPAVLIVTSAADSGAGSLRAAITAADRMSGLVTIDFSIGAAGSAHIISLKSALPAITGTVTIDGASQGGIGYTGPALIELNGTFAGSGTSGLVLTGQNSTIDGLIIEHFAQDGILLKGNATGNTIGGTTAGTGNVISANRNDGIEIVGSGAASNVVAGNFIGTTPSGTAATGNSFDGILIRNGASNNTIGGTSLAAANVISGNGNDGIEIVNTGTSNNLVEGNFIGTNLTGTGAVANKFDGVLIRTGASSNTIGGSSSGASNVISGNGNDGVEIVNIGTSNNLVDGNFVGTDVTGSAALANRFDGVIIRTGATSNTVGGTSAGTGNIISGNGNDGVEIVNAGTTKNLIQGNTIGAQVDGSSALANKAAGVMVRNGAANNTIGGTGAGAGNTIAFNNGDGVIIGITTVGTPAGIGNAIEGNSIFGNHRLGIFLGTDNISRPPVVLANNSKGHTGINNNYQNYPVLNTPIVTANSTILSGTLSSPNNPGATFRIELFATSRSSGPSTQSVGMTFLGFATVTTNSSGKGTFSLTLTTPLSAGQVITATATDPLGNTSEFSRGVVVA
jgi:titin